MISLIIQIIFSTAFGLIVKNAQNAGRNLLAVGAANYVIAAIGAAFQVIKVSSFELDVSTIIIGFLGGMAYVLSYFLIVPTVRLSGISISMAVVRISVLIPILFSIFVWKEHPNAYQTGGIVMGVLALPLLSKRNSKTQIKRLRWISLLIFGLFIFTGGCGLSTKSFSEICPDSQRAMFLTFLFGTAAVISVSAAIFQSSVIKKSVSSKDLIHGVFLGLSNILGNYFLLIALNELPGMIVFPISSSLGVVLTVVFAMTVWHEKVEKTAMAGVVAVVIAVVLINLK